MFVVMTVLTVLKVPFEKAAPPCPSDVPAPLGDIFEYLTTKRLYGIFRYFVFVEDFKLRTRCSKPRPG